MHPRRLLSLTVSTLLTLSLVACGGGGGGSGYSLPITTAPVPTTATYKITGTAAYGQPLVAQTVQAVDSAGKVCAKTTTANDGTYAIETTSCAPGAAAVYVDGYTTPSGAALAAVAVPPQGTPIINGVVNVNPLTTLLAYQAAGLAGGSTPLLDHAGVLGLLPKVTAAQYQQAKTSVLIATLLQVLQTTYGVPTTGFDPTTAPFAANGQGIDAFFDAYPLTATSNSVQLAAPGSIGYLVRVTLPTIAGAEPTVTSVTAYSVGGTVLGLTGASLTLLLNGANPLNLNVDGSFTFPTAVSSTYAVTVGTQPTGKVCTISNGSGSGITANVSNIGIACSATTYTVGGTVSGLANGAQVTLRNNGADPITVAANGAFTFATPSAYNGSTTITVSAQPVGQTCTVTNGSRTGVTANVSDVGVVCSTNTYTIGGTVSGLANGVQVTLQNNGADPTTVTASGAFTFATPVAYNGSASITVSTQPVGQTCTVINGSRVGIVANVSNVSVTCAARPIYVYVPDYGNAKVLGYRINPTTGAFSTIPGSPFTAGRQNRWVTTNPAGTFAYTTNQDDNTVSAYSINPSTGALSAVPGSPFATGTTPTSITIHPTGTFAYVSNANGNNVSAYSIDATTGALTPVAGSPFAAGVVPTKIGIHPAGTFAYVTNQNESTVSAYSINPLTGALTPVAGSPFATNGPPVAVTINSAGTFAYVTSGQASISGYSINAATGALTPIAGSPFTASYTGWGWQSLAINPAGTFAYVGTGNGGQLLNFSVDATTGALTEVPASAYGTVGSNYTVFNPAGTLAYVSNAWVLTVSVANVNPVTGALTNIPGSPFGVGARPYNIAVVQP